ncbi:MAG TPA: hypothetical protein VLQ90_11850 [Pyrinomonadaceae bacterium]|nr:hypothetical protein [Pyrinomonadaceae bacterium]
MKRSLLITLMICGIILSSGLLIATGKAPASKTRSATVVFNEPVKLLNVVLQKGEYLIVHDDELMARGEACTSVYSLTGGRKLVASFHCTPVPRDAVKNFTVRTVRVTPDAMEEFREFQFAGSTESHLVPSK